ncbi:MAG: hypothetical protein ACI9WU_000564 [Myxococcota bacterium]|jgi:hypothetical protein
MASSRRTAWLLALFVLLPASAVAQKPAPLELGLYAPRLVFESNVKRSDYVRRVAETLSAAAGVPVRGRAFTRAEDLATFIAAGRLDLALVDASVLLDRPKRFVVLARGSGPLGTTPEQVLLSGNKARGLNAVEGKRVGILDSGRRELALLSNHTFEGELSVKSWFGRVRRAGDTAELLAWLRAERVDCAVVYSHYEKTPGLHVVARLKGLALPILVSLKSESTEPVRAALERARGTGLSIPAVGPLDRLASASADGLKSLREAVRLAPGQRPVRRAVWAPGRTETLPLEGLTPKPRRRYPLPAFRGQWRRPGLPEEVQP